MRYHFELAGIRICADIPFELHMQEESKEFAGPWSHGGREASGEASPVDSIHIYLELKPVDQLPLIHEQGHWAGCHCYQTEDENSLIFYSIEQGGAPYACARWNGEGTLCECLYLKGKEYCLNYSRNIWCFTLLLSGAREKLFCFPLPAARENLRRRNCGKSMRERIL